MGISTNTVENRLSVLGSGTATITGDGSTQDIGNFSTKGDIQNGIIWVLIWKTNTLGAGTNTLYLTDVPTTITYISTPAFNEGATEFIITKDSNDATKCHWIRKNQVDTTLSTTELDSSLYIILNAPETTFITTSTTAGTNFKVRWIAMLIM